MMLALAALVCLVAAAIFDVMTFEIPDSLSIAILAAAMGYGLVTPGFGWLLHGLAVLLMFAVGLFLFSRGWLGGGDVKVMVAVAGWAGLPGLIVQLAFVSIAGGVLALGLIMARRIAAATGRTPATLPKLLHIDAPLPYAVAILVGTLGWAALIRPI
jgi:prepilin peptidase CpaA